MIGRIISTTASILLFFALVILAATTVSTAFDVVALDFSFEESILYTEEIEGLGYTLSSLFERFFFEEEFRFTVLFLLFLLPFSHSMVWNQRGNGGRYTFARIFFTKLRGYAKLVIGFPKPGFFWVICIFTNFLPILIPLAVYLLVRALILLLEYLTAPILYPITQIQLAVQGYVS
ncbi:MAG: hypothetical protein J6V07_05560 [Clostridia bacterium]|nr:hypothetical protein [Clostridia bacterium]